MKSLPSTLLLMLVIMTALSGCQNIVDERKTSEQSVQMPQAAYGIDRFKISFMEIGRQLSRGAVDLFQPGTPSLELVPPINRTQNMSISSIPGNPNIHMKDQSVMIYSLDTIEVSEPMPAPLPASAVNPAEVDEPVNLMTQDSAAPQDYIDTQPPPNLMTQGEDSPLDDNGNPQ